jgi:hypothetical protein
MPANNYCPACLSDSLSINARGTVHVILNNKQMDAGRFLFNLGKDSKDDILDLLENKLSEFFKWYSNFHNKEAIKKVDLICADFNCDNKCKLDINFRASVVDVLFKASDLEEILERLSHKHDVPLDL